MKKFGLVPRLILAIILGIVIGLFLPEAVVRLVVTFASIFSNFLKFIIPLMIIGFIIAGIADLGRGAGKLLAITTGIAYTSTIVAGTLAFILATTIFPLFITPGSVTGLDAEAGMLSPFFTIVMPPMLDVTQALVFAFTFGLCISALQRGGTKAGGALYGFFSDFSAAINLVLAKVIIPLLPLYICGTFANLTYSGQVFSILSIFWKVLVLVIALHLAYLTVFFFIAGSIGRKNPLQLIRNQVSGYLTAIGTQSSAATIPVNLTCAEKNGVSKSIREFVIPLCATIHLCGSIVTITSCVVAALMMSGTVYGFTTFFPFLLTLGIAMVAAPGAPGGAIMAALPFLSMVGIPPEGAIASLLIALYITQDSFGTAANVSGDNAIAVIIDALHQRFATKEPEGADATSTVSAAPCRGD
ncbi:MAG: dicarboxylate/amino acid:cation symporter [Deltaproteobacteria bacterium]|nr:dicarboxylate/amino acid:cation symporter [Deltaproteobacteria bacterium]